MDLKAATPGLNVTDAVSGFISPRVRGVGVAAVGPGIESPSAVYVDDVYYASTNGIMFSLTDVDQIAVLKERPAV